jgi:hypothetical protein
MKCWGIAASSLSAVTNADAGQKISHIYQTPNILYMMLWRVSLSHGSRVLVKTSDLTCLFSLGKRVGENSDFLSMCVGKKIP